MPWSLIFPFLKDLIGRVIPDPQQRLEAQRQLAELELKAREAEAQAEAAKAREFAEFIEATTPPAERVYVWANTLIALVRPFLAIFVPASFVLWPERWVMVLGAYEKLGSLGMFFVAAPTVVFVVGREGLRMMATLMAARLGGVETIKQALPPGIPSGSVEPSRPAAKPVAPPPPAPKPRPVTPPPSYGGPDNR